MANDDWKEQYRLMIRWKRRIEDISALKLELPDPDVLYDYVNSFFISCFHLGDWLFEGGHANKIDVQTYIHDNYFLNICRNIANGFKHFKIDNGEYKYDSGHYVRLFANTVDWTKFGSSTGGTTYNPKVSIPDNLNPGDCVITILNQNGKEEIYNWSEVANNCIDLWNKYLKSINLQPPIS